MMGKTYVINKSVGKSMNDSMRTFHMFYHVAVARLFQYFLDSVAGENELKSFAVAVRRFALWMAFEAKMIGVDGAPVLEYQRHCKLVLTLAVYNTTWDALRSANHELLVDVLHWIVPIVMQGPFSQYRQVVIDCLSHYHRASEVEKFLFRESLTVNYTGEVFGHTPTGKVQEYLNKRTKQSKKRDPSRHSDRAVAADSSLLQHDRDVEESVQGVFSHLSDPSEGVAKAPERHEVMKVARQLHWRPLNEPMCEKDKGQTVPFGAWFESEAQVRLVLHGLRRSKQFGQRQEEIEAEDIVVEEDE